MRRSLLLNLTLAFVWAAVVGSFTGPNLLLGFLIGYFVMRLVQPLIGTARYVHRMWYAAELILFFLRELIVASARIAVDVLTPAHRMLPGVIALPLDVDTDGQITLLANLISLTPGTLSLDVSEDRRTLFIHVMYIRGSDVDAERTRIKQFLERRVMRVFEPPMRRAP